jgi:uncharacterized protein YjbI with pentapeptide repeats
MPFRIPRANREPLIIADTPTLAAYPHLKAADLAGAQLRYTDATGGSFAECDLSGADLQDTYLDRASFQRAKLTGANLSGATAKRAGFARADLSGANLRGASLTGASFQRANLSGADVSGADLRDADFSGADLRGLIWDEVTRFNGATCNPETQLSEGDMAFKHCPNDRPTRFIPDTAPAARAA